MYLTTRALVLRVTDYNDRDALLTLLTPANGKITAKARGLRRKNSPLIAPCQLLAYGAYTLFEYRDSYTVNEASSVDLFQNLRRELTKLALGSYFAQVAELIAQEDLPNPELLSLLLNCLHMLSATDTPERKIKAVFELRVACLAGYMPDLEGSGEFIDLSSGHLVHASGGAEGIRMPLPAGTRAAMYYICTCDPKKLFSFDLGPESMEKLAQITESYLTTQLERGFSTLDFYKSLYI